jgi:hypothetical protein
LSLISRTTPAKRHRSTDHGVRMSCHAAVIAPRGGRCSARRASMKRSVRLLLDDRLGVTPRPGLATSPAALSQHPSLRGSETLPPRQRGCPFAITPTSWDVEARARAEAWGVARWASCGGARGFQGHASFSAGWLRAWYRGRCREVQLPVCTLQLGMNVSCMQRQRRVFGHG